MNGSKIKIPIYREFSSKSFGQTYLKAVLGENQSIPLGHAKDHKWYRSNFHKRNKSILSIYWARLIQTDEKQSRLQLKVVLVSSI